MLLLFWVSASMIANAAQKPMQVKSVKGESGAHYLWIAQGDSTAHWTLERPRSEDPKVVLCIPAAFTDANGLVDGFYACGGRASNQRFPDTKIGGIVLVREGKCEVMSAPSGKIDGKLLEAIVSKKWECFQQFQVVAGGKGERFKDKTCCQRRGIGTLKDGTTVIVESCEPITLTQFGKDVASMGVEQLAYADMGPWDEGWYRNPANGKLVTIGQDRSLTRRQSNWLYFKSPELQAAESGHQRKSHR